MKKLLSLLSVLTISGTAVPTTIAASSYQKKETINYQQTNNLKNLIRNKRNIKINNFNINYLERLYAQDWTKDLLRIWISKETWNEINFLKKISLEEEFQNRLILLINNFIVNDSNDIQKEGQLRVLNNENKKVIVNKIIEKYNEIKKFQNNSSKGLILTTTIDGEWFDNFSILSQFTSNEEVNPPAGKNSGATLRVDYKFLASDKISIFLRGTEVNKYFNNFSKLTWIDFTKWLDYYIDNMQAVDHTGSGGKIENSDINIAKTMMRKYLFKLDNTCFNKKAINTLSCNSFKIQTNRNYEDITIEKNYA